MYSSSAELRAHSAKMASGGVSVASLWTEVNRCGQNGDYTRALKALTKSRNSCLVSVALKRSQSLSISCDSS